MWEIDLGTYLPECRGIETLAVWTGEAFPDLINLVDGLPLRRLSISFEYLFGRQPANFRDHPFPNLTHLEIILPNLTHLEIINGREFWPKVEEISLLPSLTHLAYHNFPGSDAIAGSLKHCTKLQVLALLIDDNMELTEWDQPKDRICVVLRWSAVADWQEDWHIGTRGGRDIWVLAEEVVAGREGEKNW